MTQSSSYPYLEIARKYGVDYGDVLWLSGSLDGYSALRARAVSNVYRALSHEQVGDLMSAIARVQKEPGAA